MTFDIARFQPKLWLDASDSSTRTIDTGVSQLSDKSGNGNHLLQATGSLQPTVSAGEKNGLDMLKFDGTDDYLETAGAFASTNLTVFVVYAKGGDNQRVLDTRGTGAFTTKPGWHVKNYGSFLGDIIAVEDAAGGYRGLALGTTDYAGSYVIAFVTFDAISSTLTGRTFGGITSYSLYSSGGDSISAANVSNPLTIGANYGGYDSQLFSGYFGEAIIFDGVVPDDTRNAIEGYLSDKWGIALAPDHRLYDTKPEMVTVTAKNGSGALVSGRTVRGYRSDGELVYDVTTDSDGAAVLAYGEDGFITAHGETGKNDLIKSIITDPVEFNWGDEPNNMGGINAILLSTL